MACSSISPVGARATCDGRFEGMKPSYWLDDVQCVGNEDSLFDCVNGGIGRHNCRQGERAGVKCLRA